MVIVFNRLHVAGWAGQSPCEVPEHPCRDLSDALKLMSRGELLVAAYGRTDGLPLPRLTKGALGRFANHPIVRLQAILVDVDYEDHQVPPDGWAEEVANTVPDSLGPCGWYRTPHGVRLFWNLEETLPLIYADSAIQQVHDQLNEAGIPTDRGTCDWTRMQRCPHAFDLDLPHGGFDEIPTLSFDLDTLEASSPQKLGKFIDGEQPANVDKLTRKELAPVASVHKKLADLLYRGALTANVGERHETLLKAAIVISFANESNDPLVPYRALYGSCKAMEKPFDELWRICTWSAAAQDAHQKETKKQQIEATVKAAEDLDTNAAEVKQRLILDNGKEFYVWDSDEKTYSTPYLNQRQLLAALKRHCPILADDVLWEGEAVPNILRDYSSPLDHVVYSHSAEKTKYDAERNELLFPSAKIDPNLSPTYSEDVDGWLQAFFGPEHYDDGLRWLAAFPSTDRPVCALYIQGPRSIGKGMFAKGLARLWSPHGEYTPYSEVTGSFQSKMLSAPLIVADEKVPQDAFRNNDSSVFRRLVGNGVHNINRKNVSEVTLLGFPRVLITANNDDALNIREDLDAADLDAVKLRVGYIERGKDESAKEYIHRLVEERELKDTYELTTPWVQKKIAEHVLWLYHNHEFEPDKRFLVEGWESNFTNTLVTSVGSAGPVAETLVLAIERGRYTPAIRWFGGYVYVNASLLASEWEIVRGNDVDRPPSSASRLKALRSLSEGKKKRIRDEAGNQKRYWAIPGAILARLAEDQNLMGFEELMEAVNRPRDAEHDESSGPKDNIIDLHGKV